MKKPATLIFALLTIVLAGLSFHLWQRLREAEATAAREASERETLQTRLADLEKRARTLQGEVTAQRPRTNSDRTRAESDTGPRTAGGPPGPGRSMQFMESPEMRRLMAIEQKGRLDGRYAALFKSLKLPPEQLDKLKQLLVDKQSAPMDVFAEARTQGLVGPESRAQIQELLKSTNQEIDESIHSALGDEAYSQYQNYERTQGQRSLVDQLTNRLSYTDSPLSTQQAEQLVSVLAANTAAASADNPRGVVSVTAFAGPGGGPPMMFGNAGGGTAISNEAITSAQSMLSSAQLEALRQLQAEQQAQQQMGQAMRQNIGGGGGTATIISTPGGTTVTRGGSPE